MPFIIVSERLMRVLRTFTPGANLQTQLENVTCEGLESQHRKCRKVMNGFDIKYGMTFAEFAPA